MGKKITDYVRAREKYYSKEVFLILDNLRVHHSKIVKKWVTEHPEKTALFYLPSYSSDRNSDEYLNYDLKYEPSDKPAPKTQEKMKWKNCIGNRKFIRLVAK